MRTAIVAVAALILAVAGVLWWMGRGPSWTRPDFQADRAEIDAKMKELETTQVAVSKLSQRLRGALQEAEVEKSRALSLAGQVREQASEVGRLRDRLRTIEGRERPPVPATLTEGVHALSAMGY